jgi:hypothetical protein
MTGVGWRNLHSHYQQRDLTQICPPFQRKEDFHRMSHYQQEQLTNNLDESLHMTLFTCNVRPCKQIDCVQQILSSTYRHHDRRQ